MVVLFKKENMDNRTNFVKTWLTESPVGIGEYESFDGLLQIVNELINFGYESISFGGNYYKLEMSENVYYWYEENNQIILIITLQKEPEALIIRMIGKNKEYRNKPPYATDLYSVILKDSNKNIRLLSDKSLSNDGLEIWKRLFNQGYKISVYDKSQPGKTFKPFQTLEDFAEYFSKTDNVYSKYQYILSENNLKLGEALDTFGIRRIREIAGILLEDQI